MEPSSDTPYILAAATNVAEQSERKILQINYDGTIDEIQWEPARRVQSVWFINSQRIYTAGGGVYVRNADRTWERVLEMSDYYTWRIRGSAANDVFVTGTFGFVGNYNGVNWQVIGSDLSSSKYFYFIDCQSYLTVVVGENNCQGVISIIRRQ